jgi:hypothetical protein
MCLGTWMGFLISGLFITFGIPTPLLIPYTPISIFLHGLLSTGGVWILHNLEEMFERIGNKTDL